jgi:hypothetical protein
MSEPASYTVRMWIGSIGLLCAGLYLTATKTFSDFATDWQHKVAGPIAILGAIVLLWLRARNRA